MIDHVLGRPSVKSRRFQVLAVLAFWSVYIFKGHRHGPPVLRLFSKLSSKKLTAWQTVLITMMYLYAARNFSTLVGLASPEPMSNMYDKKYFRATWVLTALDAGYWTAMRIKYKWLRDIASLVFSAFYMVAAEQADEKVRKVRGMLTVEHLRVSWNKGTTPYLQFLQGLVRPRFTRWPPRAIRIPRPSSSDYNEVVSGWLYYDGPIADLEHINKMILDIPGGGFVAMDPRCNDDKLFAWSGKTGLPVLSLDYKKAPEFPYPYALNECFDVYTSIVKSKGRCIGMSGKRVPKIVLTGDSAGGNLATALTLMIIESNMSHKRPGSALAELPVPDGLVLLYPGLDMNIGNWMSDEQMALVKDRRMRGTNKDYLRRKSRQYTDVAGTPHESEDEGDTPSMDNAAPKASEANGAATAMDEAMRSPHPEYSHAHPQTWPQSPAVSPISQRRRSSSHKAQPLQTRLAMSSMISYFNDRVLTPEMMRAMIILYVGPHNRPDFSQDYLLSPILAPDILLQKFPKTHFLTGERDPLVDDTVIFAGRLRKAKQAYHSQRTSQHLGVLDDISDFDEKDVCEVVLIPGISHGFTQFPTLYPPAWKLIDRCAMWAVDLLNAAELRDRREHEQRAAGRHHRRVESSGDEGGLEINMTKAPRGGRTSSDEKVPKEAPPPQSDTAEETQESDGLSSRRKRGNNGRARLNGKSKSIIKLKSTDDLLGRRMQGLAGSLTGGMRDEDD
ncbi:Alpha/Beta hydrolase protein [Pestalotiopsis sp. NC0098]|nr:Alpha/Beta hydrolase protein [Pestalotiopsis sp. NC0098]